jgi:hypothetical protein
MANRVRARLTLVAVNVLVFAVVAEAAALFAYYVDRGTLFYTDHRSYDSPVADLAGGRLTGEALHPYFGPTHKPGVAFELPESLRAPGAPPPHLQTNNFGFVSPHDYPYQSAPGQYVIGLFGGSVGLWFCQVGAVRLLEDLERDPFFAGKELVPLCFSHEGYKQPQQLLVLTYFLELGQPLDLVVNIDGFNDVALANLNDQRGLDISMPSVQHLDPLVNLVNQSTLTPEKLASLAAIQRDRERLASLTARLQRTHFATVQFVLDRLYRRALNDYASERGRFSNLPSNAAADSLIQVTSAVRHDPRGRFDDMAAQWARASLLMNDLLAARGIPYFHFLQPNQYGTHRAFSDAESRVAISNESPYKTAVEQGYPALLAQRESLAKERFFDATGVFDREPSPVYQDNCCHYTRTGNYVLADFIARSILASPGAWNHDGLAPGTKGTKSR